MDTISNIDLVKQGLRALPDQIVRDMFPAALAAGAAVIESELLVRTPYDPHAPAPHLRDDIATTIAVDRLQGSAQTGFGELGERALWLEYGHAQTGHQPRHQFIREIPPVGFMRRTADSTEEAAVNAFAAALDERL